MMARGGVRPGAGRKAPLSGRAIKKEAFLDPELLRQIGIARGGTSLSQWLEDAARERLDRELAAVKLPFSGEELALIRSVTMSTFWQEFSAPHLWEDVAESEELEAWEGTNKNGLIDRLKGLSSLELLAIVRGGNL